jgi:hypothetical protein
MKNNAKNLLLVFFMFAAIHGSLFSIEKIIYITTGSIGKLFSESGTSMDTWDRIARAFALKGYTFKQTFTLDGLKNFEYLIVNDVPIKELDKLKQYDPKKLVLLLWEPPCVKPYNYEPQNHSYFSKVLTWNDDFVDQQKYYKSYYPQYSLAMLEHLAEFSQKKLCTMVAGLLPSQHPNELYSKRKELVEFFETAPAGDFEFYGNRGWKTPYKNYKGTIGMDRKGTDRILAKIEVLNGYKFCICYENQKEINGYVTEKILHCFRAGCVPVYWGAKNIERYVPRNCFISREDFKSNAHLYDYLKNMPQAVHQEYIDNIRFFMESPQAHLFSVSNLIATLFHMLNIK